MIKESVIEQIVDQLSSEELEDKFVEEQHDYWNYLNSDGFSGISEAERQMLFFVNSVVYNTCRSLRGEPLEFDLEAFQDEEETNWAVREGVKEWSEAKDKYFENYSEEDLLAFTEDMLVEEEVRRLSDIGKEVIFITTKSYIDYLKQSGQL